MIKGKKRATLYLSPNEEECLVALQRHFTMKRDGVYQQRSVIAGYAIRKLHERVLGKGGE